MSIVLIITRTAENREFAQVQFRNTKFPKMSEKISLFFLKSQKIPAKAGLTNAVYGVFLNVIHMRKLPIYVTKLK